ncbi:MAG: histidinol dehydrogenase [Gemmataceae bacterium]
MGLAIARIDGRRQNVQEWLRQWRRGLSLEGATITPRSQRLTERLFGEPLTPQQSVERICADVERRGWEAVAYYSRALDDFELTPDNLRVSEQELASARQRVEPHILDVMRQVHKTLMTFQLGIVMHDARWQEGDGLELTVRYRPVRRVGLCIPGGAAAYPSTLLMTACPARAAGVPEIVAMAPPTARGAHNPIIQALCQELGIRELYRLGGAHGVAALAYGVEGLPPVDMIVGPGNLYVTLAKKRVFGRVGIDVLAGPTELVILADADARPEWIAADLIAQAEHAPGACVLLTWSEKLWQHMPRCLEEQLGYLPHSELARDSLERFGALVLVSDADRAVDLANEIAAEHVQISAADAARLAQAVHHAGAIFLGYDTPVAVGDYVAGPSHVLPTGGTARFASGLSANDFLRRSTLVRFTRDELARRAPWIRTLADLEGLPGHARSVDIRLG